MNKPAAAPSALMRQYLDVKSRYPDAILFFRLGDFYEMFYEDAVLVARLLNLTLTTRDKGREDPVPMCGVPHHAVRGYLAKLTDLGHRVAICEQLEDPRAVRGIVKRDVVRVVTPGVILDEESLDPRSPSHVAAVCGSGRRGYGLAFVDVSTGSFRATEAPSLEALLDELARAEPRELVLRKGDGDLAAAVRRAYPRLTQTGAADTAPPDDDPARAAALIAQVLGDRFDPAAAKRAPMAVIAAASVLAYAKATQPGASLALSALEIFERSDYLIIDEQARAHLELTETLLDRKRPGSLLDVIDETRSAMGGRMLRRWLLFPLIDVARIRRRQDAVERLIGAHTARDRARKILGELGDIERLAGRVRLAVASPRDLVALGTTLARLPELTAALAAAAESEIPGATSADDAGRLGPDLASDLAERILQTLRPDSPANTKEGGYVRAGVSAELDELAAIASGGRERLAEIEVRERERTGISSLKVRYNSVFGYFIEVTRAQLERVPADYVRKQTVANAERFVTPELADFEAKILTADDKRIALELEIFTALRDAVGGQTDRLLAVAARVAEVDALAALAEVAHRAGYCRPVVDEGRVIEILDGRHPVVERLAARDGFVPNDVRLDPDAEQVIVVTGPNMAGKSTVIRQVALTAILAQMGAFVPARAAHIGLCDRVFTRVGAGDNLARGESTFLVEMRETAHILRHATDRSLVVLDEIGRGTSTYDGVSIAWAVAEHLHDVVGARTLFATHYHELCALAETHPRIRNVSVAAREWEGEVVFLRKLTPGAASRSFGIEVARLAGLPDGVVARARAILATLEVAQAAAPDLPRSAVSAATASGEEVAQLGLFAAESGDEVAQSVVDTLRYVDPDELSPRQAWDLVAALRKKLT